MKLETGSALLIKVSQEIIVLNKQKFSLNELQEYVSGYIQIVRMKDYNYFIILDEDGKLKNKPINALATILADISNDDYIVGDVVVCHPEQID